MAENEKIKEIRKELGLTQQEMADALCVSKQYLSKVENGLTELSKEKIILLCKKFNISVNWLLMDKGFMYLGEIVEIAPKEEFFANHKHPYSQALLDAVPVISDDGKEKKIKLEGDLPSPTNLPDGCKFHTRCVYATDKCRTEKPQLKEIAPNHKVRCFLFEK